jgi:Uma2 family endonuclease
METIVLQRKKWTLTEYHQLGALGMLSAEDRVELIGGEIIPMSPVGIKHKAYVRRLNRLLSKRVGELGLVDVQSPLVVGDQEPVPDLVILKPEPSDYDQTDPSAQDALVVIEVSDTTLKTDQGVKVPMYAAANIAEVWVVEVVGEKIWVYRNPSPDGYLEIKAYERGSTLNVLALPGVQIAVNEVFRR